MSGQLFALGAILLRFTSDTSHEVGGHRSDSYRRIYLVKWGNELGPTAMLLGAALQADHGYLLRDSSSRISGKDVIGIRTPKGWRGEVDSRYEMLCAIGIFDPATATRGGGQIHMP